MSDVLTVAELDTFIIGTGIYAGTAQYPAGWSNAFRQGRLDAAEAWAARYTGRSLIATTAARKFDGNGSKSLFVDDLLSITSLTESTNALTEGSDYFSYPANSTPKFRLDRYNATPSDATIQSTLYAGKWALGQQNIVITGSWGYFTAGNCPDDLAEAILMLATLFMLAGPSIPPVGAMSLQRYSAGTIEVEYSDGSRRPARETTGWGEYIKAILDGHKRVVWL